MSTKYQNHNKKKKGKGRGEQTHYTKKDISTRVYTDNVSPWNTLLIISQSNILMIGKQKARKINWHGIIYSGLKAVPFLCAEKRVVDSREIKNMRERGGGGKEGGREYQDV